MRRYSRPASALLLVVSALLTSAPAPTSAGFDDFKLSHNISGGFKCTSPASSTFFHLLQFCFIPKESAFIYIQIDFGDGTVGGYGAQVTEGEEYCRPKRPKPIIDHPQGGGGVGENLAYVEFDETRVLQAKITTGSEGCVVEEETIPIFNSSGETSQISEGEQNRGEEKEPEFEIVPASRYGDTIMPVQAIVGLKKDDTSKSGVPAESRPIAYIACTCATLFISFTLYVLL